MSVIVCLKEVKHSLNVYLRKMKEEYMNQPNSVGWIRQEAKDINLNWQMKLEVNMTIRWALCQSMIVYKAVAFCLLTQKIPIKIDLQSVLIKEVI